jgi:hypothetical protein
MTQGIEKGSFGRTFIVLIADIFFQLPVLLNKKDSLAVYGIRTLNLPTGIRTQNI